MIDGLARCAVTVENAQVVAFHGDALPDEVELGELELGDPARVVVAAHLPVAEAVPVLSRARRRPDAHPTAGYWGSVVLFALRLVAQGHRRPEDTARLRELAAAMPADARTPRSGRPEDLVHAFVAAIAGAAADERPAVMDAPPVIDEPEIVDGLRGAVRCSLRLEADGTCVAQAHPVGEPGTVFDAVEVWARGDATARATLTTALTRGARSWPPLRRLLLQTTPDRIALTESEVGDLLTTAPRLSVIGLAVHWPRDLLGTLTEHVVLGRTERDGTLSAQWEFVLDGVPLTRAEIDRLADTHHRAVRLRDKWVVLGSGPVPRALPPMAAAEALGAALVGSTEVDGRRVEVVADGWLAGVRARIADPESGAPVAQPAALAATLRDYQLRGLRWLARMSDLGLGACLADDMGLGKTITLIALHLHRQSDVDTRGPTLVVCPASLLGNWAREIRRFAPGVPVRRYHGATRSVADDGFVLTTYATMRRDASLLALHRWGLVVADEAQHVKNPAASTAKALRTIPAVARVALTGTPVENGLLDLWAILDWTTPGLLGTLDSFRARWVKPIAADPAVAERFARLVGPFLLRRKKSDPGIAPELPPKTETDHPVPLTREQIGLYTAAARGSMAAIRDADGMARRGQVMRLLTVLKQICNHPAHYLAEESGRTAGRSGKLALLDELLDTILAEDGAVLVFTQYVAMARLLERHLRERGVATGFLHGGTPVARRDTLVAEFTAGAFPVFLLSLKAAGTGLNLTRADHVVHYDRWWNPAVEDQATDRAYRIGQTRPVQVHRLIAEGTVEDRVAALLASKRDLAASVLSGGESALTELTDDELAALVELRA
ncbi:DEAD/DEAH box helicase [Actinokineospora sp. NBRC 105648]|uniref:DEAD/DEAH box helicase n=1 Tax=Actinokineospora sp. NBRC 105648 TaxID=3032206 RepID=UPI0024A35DFC|nr:DEAD/DEAH box helicase [Actinokineospora sp. NBRC 105648]GLZ40216.1 helicase SNF2 [Actinokineospora sp. NBRC 105648]